MNKLTEIELRWHDLKTESPPGDGCVVLFPNISDVGIFFETRLYISSNPEYARLNALEQGYTHWFPIPSHPQEAEIRTKIEEMYAPDRYAQEQFYKGFQIASENIVAYLKELVPDRPSVARVIEEMFANKNKTGE
jgi:hypothetical protein